MAVYAVSDLHGYYDVFTEGLRKISFGDEDFLYVIGDAIDRGKDGIKLLQHIMSHGNMDLIIGNHEFMMLNSVSPSGTAECNERDAILWLNANGGITTFNQYRTLSKEDRVALIEWLKSRYVIKTMNVGGRSICLTHSYYKARCRDKSYSELNYKDIWIITWSSIWRDDAMTHAAYIYSDYEYTFITGHVPVQTVRRWQEPEDDWNVLKSYKHGNLINIDGGCAIGLTNEVNNGTIFLRLDDFEEYPIIVR